MLDKRELKKKTILDVAQKIFSRFGLNKTTMNEIAKATRMGKATLYHYFTSKEQVFSEVINRESKIYTNKLNESIKVIDEPKEKLRAYIKTRINTFNSLINTYSAMTDEYLGNYSDIKKYRESFFKTEIQTLVSILDENNNQKELIHKKNIEIAKVISLMFGGIEFLIISGENSEFTSERIDIMLQILLNGIC